MPKPVIPLLMKNLNLFNIMMALTYPIRGTSGEELCKEFDLWRCWFKKLSHCYNIKFPLHLFSLISDLNGIHGIRCSNNITSINAKHDYFKNSFLYPSISKWNKLARKIRNVTSLSILKKNLLKFIWPCTNSILDIHHVYEVKPY